MVASADEGGIESAFRDLDAQGASLRGLLQIGSAAGPVSEAVRRRHGRLGASGLDWVALLSLRDAEPAGARAWETRTWIDGLLLGGAGGLGRRWLGLCVGPEPSAERLGRLLARSWRGELPDGVYACLEAAAATATESPLAAGLKRAGSRGERMARADLLALAPGEKRRKMERLVADALATVLSLGERERAALDLDRPLAQLGLDSLMMVELFLGLSQELELEISREGFPESPSPVDVAAVLLAQLEQAASEC